MRGFTLMEIVITVAIFSLLIALGLFMSMETFRGVSYRSEVDVIVSLLQKARSRAMNNIEQAPWGVCYDPPNYLVFKGSDCNAAFALDRVEANASVAAASDFDSTFPPVVFSQLSGQTTEESIVVKQNDRTSTISINEAGTILW